MSEVSGLHHAHSGSMTLPCNFYALLPGKQCGYDRSYLHISTPVYSSTARSSHKGSGFWCSVSYNISPFLTLWRCSFESPWVLSVNIRMESTDELDVGVAGVLSQAPEVLTVYYLHVSREVVWTCSAFSLSRTNPERLAGHSCWLHARSISSSYK